MRQHKQFVVEARESPKGPLRFDVEQPPFITATENQLCDYYFRHNPEKASAGLDEVYAWYNARHWYIRPKTW